MYRYIIISQYLCGCNGLVNMYIYNIYIEREGGRERGRKRKRMLEIVTSWSKRNQDSMNSYLFFLLHTREILLQSDIHEQSISVARIRLQSYTTP